MSKSCGTVDYYTRQGRQKEQFEMATQQHNALDDFLRQADSTMETFANMSLIMILMNLQKLCMTVYPQMKN